MLWQAVTETVTPRPDATIPDLPTLPEVERRAPSPLSSPRRHAATAPPIAKTVAPIKMSATEAGDPRSARRVARGRMAIDATLDLHGYTQESARARLIHFVDFAILRGNRVLLVITGKGRPEDEEYIPFGEAPRGILRQRFLEWVEQPPLRERLSSVRQSHQKHGGRGAFYVFLKSNESLRL